jgi:hypothetical protein
MKSKRQTTRAKLARERLIQERRALKLERKHGAPAAHSDTALAQDAQEPSGTVSVDGDQ